MELTDFQKVVASIAAYSFCSGTLVLLNKLTLHYLPFPSLVIVVQLVAAVTLIYGAQAIGQINVDPLKWEHVKPYMLYIFFFSTGVYSNMRSLQYSNVETVIVFRALSPVCVAFLDALFLGREWPSPRSWTGLVTVVVGACGYASLDERFQTQGFSAYTWPFLYMVIIALEMAYGKKIVKSVPLETLSGPVVYTNILGILPMMALASVKDEYSALWDYWWSMTSGRHMPPAAIALLVVGSLVGTGIGYSGWWCRSLVSATSFTLVGVMNKCLTIILNSLIWDQHANAGGIAWLLLCIGGGVIYKQAPMRKSVTLQAEPLLSKDDDAFKTEVRDDEIDLVEKQSEASVKRRG